MIKTYHKLFLILFIALFINGCSTITFHSSESVAKTKIGNNYQESSTMAPSPATDQTTTQSNQSSSDELTVHFIDVGQADSILVTCGGQAMLVDGGNVEDSSLVVSYLKKQSINELKYMFDTHAHEDHVGGLSGPLNTVRVDEVIAPVASYESKAFNDFVHHVHKQGLDITIPKSGDIYALGDATIILYRYLDYGENVNNESLVLRIVHGKNSFLLTGDIEREAEADILSQTDNLESTVLKVPHHGADTSSSYPFLRAVMPKYSIISVGKGNSYGHPADAVLSRLRDADSTVYRTDMQGTIVMKSDGQTITIDTSKTSSTATNPTNINGTGQESSEKSQVHSPKQLISASEYIGNSSSKKFHLPTCNTLPSEQNQITYDSRQEAIDSGYTACKNCCP